MVLDLDQYSDGKAARLWGLYIGDQTERTRHYKHFLQSVLSKHNCRTVLDVACGTGVDSTMLLEEGYEVTSCDFSDKMLKTAWQTRWQRRKEAAFDAWEIYEANWLTLNEDLAEARQQYDAVICLGNSFAHLPDLTGNQDSHRLALRNFAAMVRPGGVLLIDHRNYDFILDHGRAPSRNIYYNSKYVSDIRTSVVYQNGAAKQIILDYFMTNPQESSETVDNAVTKPAVKSSRLISESTEQNEFTLTYYPHRLNKFSELVTEAFDAQLDLRTYGDFQPLGELADPAFFIHVAQRSLNTVPVDVADDASAVTAAESGNFSADDQSISSWSSEEDS